MSLWAGNATRSLLPVNYNICLFLCFQYMLNCFGACEVKQFPLLVTLFLIELLGCIFISSLRLFRLLKLLWLKHTGQDCKTLPLPSPRLLVCRLATSARFIFLWCLEQKGTTPILSYNIPTFFGIICYIRCVAWYMRWSKIYLYIWKNSPNKNITYLTGQNCYQLVAIALCMEH